MVKELSEKSNETEENVSDLKAVTESCNINIALNHRQVTEVQEDFKEILDKHTAEIEELKNRPVAVNSPPPPVEIPVMPEIKAGDGLELAQLMNLFATKKEPDNTIKRLYDLENAMKDMHGRVNSLDGLTDRLESLEGRVSQLEKRADISDKRLDTHDADIDELKRRLTAVEGMEMPALPSEPANIDTGSILKQIQIVKNEFNTFKLDMPRQQEIDLNKLRNELMGYTDQELSNLQ